MVLATAYRNVRHQKPHASPVVLKLRLLARTRRLWDLDNRIKSLQDCLAPAGVILDDVQVEQITASVVRGTRQPDATEVEVWTLE